VSAPSKGSNPPSKGGRPKAEEPPIPIEVSCEPKLVAYLDELVQMQGFGTSRPAVARAFIWKEIHRLIEVNRLKQR
jgi:hypothetical protein